MGMNYYSSMTNRHIGKQSMGWAFVFHNYGYKNFADAVLDIAKEGIYNEMGEISHTTFWKMVADNQHKKKQSTIGNVFVTSSKLDGYDFIDGEFC